MNITELTERDIAVLNAQLQEERKILVALLPVHYTGVEQPIYHGFGSMAETVEDLLQTFTDKYNTYEGRRTFYVGFPLCIFSRLRDCPDLPTMWAKILMVKRSSILRYSKENQI